jgi:hypothetical protein
LLRRGANGAVHRSVIPFGILELALQIVNLHCNEKKQGHTFHDLCPYSAFRFYLQTMAGTGSKGSI